MASWLKAWTVRTPLTLSSTWAPTSAIRSWLARDRRRTRRPNTRIGTSTSGTTRNTSPVSRALVTASNTVPPTSMIAFRSAIETEVPTTICRTLVSVVRRDRISPVRVTS